MLSSQAPLRSGGELSAAGLDGPQWRAARQAL
jgi:hypothetical protein